MTLDPRRFRAARRALALVTISSLAPLGAASCTSFAGAVADVGYFDFTDAARLCARVFSCPGLASSLRQSLAVPVDDVNFSICMSWLAGPTPPPPRGFAVQAEALARVAGAPSCADAVKDLDIQVLAPGDARCDAGADVCLDDEDLLDCHERRRVRCSSAQFVPGSQCLAKDGIGRCKTDLGPEVCGSLFPVCSSDTLVVCDKASNLRQAVKCAALDQTCFPASGPFEKAAVCAGEGGKTTPLSCSQATGSGWMGCSSDGVVLCNQRWALNGFQFSGVQVLYDCQTSLGWSCQQGLAGSIPYCERPDAECSPGDADVNRCDGDTLRACIGGRRADIDCAVAGATCVVSMDRGGRCEFTP